MQKLYTIRIEEYLFISNSIPIIVGDTLIWTYTKLYANGISYYDSSSYKIK